jgi:hypothetical protein
MQNVHITLQRDSQRNRIAASVIVSGALLVTYLFLVSDSQDALEGRSTSQHTGRGRDWEGARFSSLLGSTNFDPLNPFVIASDMLKPDAPPLVGMRHIAHSSVGLPPQGATYVDSNPGVPASGIAWGRSEPGQNLPGTLGELADQTTMGGVSASEPGNWQAENCADPPCGFGVPQPELSGGNPGRVAGWLGRQVQVSTRHMRVSSAGPGFLARIPLPKPISSSSYLMSRHLHFVLFGACKDANTSLEGTAECVSKNGVSVQKAMQYLMWGPTAKEREEAVGKNGVFAGRMFQRYLKADPYLIGEDWPRSVLRFPDHEVPTTVKTHAVNISKPDNEAGACARFSVAQAASPDTSASNSWAPIQGSNSASMLTKDQCCALCLFHAECKAWQLEEEGGFCRLMKLTPSSRGRMPLSYDQYSQVGLLTDRGGGAREIENIANAASETPPPASGESEASEAQSAAEASATAVADATPVTQRAAAEKEKKAAAEAEVLIFVTI